MINNSQRKLMVSIIIPLFNKEKEVLRAVNSVLSQTAQDFEIVVVNDGSTDKGPDIVRALKEPRIKVIDQDNGGVSAARNRGIEESRAELIAFLDADDEWAPDFLETIMHLKDKFPKSEVFATNYVFRRKNKLLKKTVIRGLPEGFKEGILIGYFKIASQSDPPIWSSAVAISKKALKSVEGFPVGVTAGEDLLVWARLAIEYDIAYSIEPKAFFGQPSIASERPGRIPDMYDYVGNELKSILAKSEGKKCLGLRDYIGLWYKNRASTYLQLGKKHLALKEIYMSLKYSGINLKLVLYALGTALPNQILISLLRAIKQRGMKINNGK
jgi:glycosyltransferase involved in cell wall biosynthesis